jgi:hypothetical protein
MPRFLAVSSAGVLLLASCLCVYRSLPQEPRGLEADRLVYDFGERPQGESLTAAFPVTNRGDQVVRIRTVLKDCGCSEALVPKGVLSPGESMVVQVTWDTKGRRGKSTTGVQILYRKDSDPLDTQELHLKLTAQIEPEYDIHPTVLEFDPEDYRIQTNERSTIHFPETAGRSNHEHVHQSSRLRS